MNEEIKIKNSKIKRKCKYIGCRKMVQNEEYCLNTKEFKICCESHSKYLTIYEKPDECPICLEEFDIENSIPLIPCSHWICKKCVINSGKNECPICRQQVELTKLEMIKCNKINLERQKEKEEQQLIEDRRMAEQMQRELNQNERINVQPVIIRRMPLINIDNIEEMLIVIDAIEDQLEQAQLRRYLTNMLQLAAVVQEENNEVE
jgi:hypothetical protein